MVSNKSGYVDITLYGIAVGRENEAIWFSVSLITPLPYGQVKFFVCEGPVAQGEFPTTVMERCNQTASRLRGSVRKRLAQNTVRILSRTASCKVLDYLVTSGN